MQRAEVEAHLLVPHCKLIVEARDESQEVYQYLIEKYCESKIRRNLDEFIICLLHIIATGISFGQAVRSFLEA